MCGTHRDSVSIRSFSLSSLISCPESWRMGEGKLRTSRKGNKDSCVELRNKSILATNVLVSDGKKKKSPDIVQKKMWVFFSMWVREDNFSLAFKSSISYPSLIPLKIMCLHSLCKENSGQLSVRTNEAL